MFNLLLILFHYQKLQGLFQNSLKLLQMKEYRTFPQQFSSDSHYTHVSRSHQCSYCSQSPVIHHQNHHYNYQHQLKKQTDKLQQEQALQTNEPVEKYNDFITWSLISMVIFLPMFIFWVPAFIYSLKAKYKYHKKDIRNGLWYAKISMFYNLCCLILGLIFYLNAMILVPMFLTRNVHYHILVIMVPIVFIYILHFLRYLVVVNA